MAVIGIVSAIQGSNGECAFFQVGNAAPWYAISASDGGFAENYALLLMAYIAGQTVEFVVDGICRGQPKVGAYILMGTYY